MICSRSNPRSAVATVMKISRCSLPLLSTKHSEEFFLTVLLAGVLRSRLRRARVEDNATQICIFRHDFRKEYKTATPLYQRH